jgi:hypothetical protein
MASRLDQLDEARHRAAPRRHAVFACLLLMLVPSAALGGDVETCKKKIGDSLRVQLCMKLEDRECVARAAEEVYRRCMGRPVEEKPEEKVEKPSPLREALRKALREKEEREARARHFDPKVYACEADGPYCWVIGVKGHEELVCGREDKSAIAAAGEWKFSESSFGHYDACPAAVRNMFSRSETGARPPFRTGRPAETPAAAATEVRLPTPDAPTPSTITGREAREREILGDYFDPPKLGPRFELGERFYPDGSRCLAARAEDCRTGSLYDFLKRKPEPSEATPARTGSPSGVPSGGAPKPESDITGIGEERVGGIRLNVAPKGRTTDLDRNEVLRLLKPGS